MRRATRQVWGSAASLPGVSCPPVSSHSGGRQSLGREPVGWPSTVHLSWGRSGRAEENQPAGDLDPQGRHFRQEFLPVITLGAPEAKQPSVESLLLQERDKQRERGTAARHLPCPRGTGRASYLDAAPMEPGLPAVGAHQSLVGQLLLHVLQANDAGGLAVLACLHCLRWPVLLTEGPGWETEEPGEVREC